MAVEPFARIHWSSLSSAKSIVIQFKFFNELLVIGHMSEVT